MAVQTLRGGAHLRSAGLWFLAAVGLEVLTSLAWRLVDGLTGIRDAVGPTNADLAEAFLGTLVVAGLMLRVAWSKALRQGGPDPRGWLGDRPVQHPRAIALLISLDAAYVVGATWWAARGTLHGFSADLAWWAQGLVLATAIVVGPLWEEVFFRGWLWAGVERDRGPGSAAWITSALWLASHLVGGWQGTLLLVPTALALAATRCVGNSLRASLALHGVNNAASILAAHWLVLS